METQEQTIDLQELFWTLRRYTWLIILSIEVCLCAGVVYYKNSTPVYESQILVAVDDHTPMSSALEPLVRSDRNTDNPRERVLAVESKIRGRAFLADIVRRLGLNRDPQVLLRARIASRRWRGVSPEEYALRFSVDRIGKKISVSPGRASLIRIVVRDVNPQAAQKLAGMIGDALIEESRRSTLTRLQARGEFSNDQIAVYEERVRKAENALREFQESNLRAGLASGPINADNLDDARSLQRSSEEEMEQVRARIQAGRDEWQATTGGASVPELTNSNVVKWTASLGALEASYATSLLRGGPDSRAESELLQTRIATFRQSLFSEFDQLAQAIPGQVTAGARAAAAGIALDSAVLKSVKARRDELASLITTYLKGVERSPRAEIELQRLRADVQSSRDLLVTLQKEATSSRLSEALATSALGPQIDVVEPPLLPLSPSSPQPFRILGVAFLLGPVLAGGIVFAGEKLGLVLRTTEQAETEFGLKVIGTVPRIEGWSRPGGYMRNNWAKFAVVAVFLVTCIFFVFNASVSAHRAAVDKTIGLLP